MRETPQALRREYAKWGGRPRERVVGDIRQLLADKGLVDQEVKETIIKAILPHVAQQANIERGIPRSVYRRVLGELHTEGRAANSAAFIAFKELDVRKDGKRNWRCIVIADDRVATMADYWRKRQERKDKTRARATAKRDTRPVTK